MSHHPLPKSSPWIYICPFLDLIHLIPERIWHWSPWIPKAWNINIQYLALLTTESLPLTLYNGAPFEWLSLLPESGFSKGMAFQDISVGTFPCLFDPSANKRWPLKRMLSLTRGVYQDGYHCISSRHLVIFIQNRELADLFPDYKYTVKSVGNNDCLPP